MTLLSTRRRGRMHAVASAATPGEPLVRVSGGYLPDVVYATAGRPIRIAFLREETAASSEHVLFPAFGKSTMLPAGQTVVVELPARPPGTYEFTCAMGILRGRLVVTAASER
jgi:plastocyanin domain-containing protein